jgi:peptidyl-prolyl cis-trans isomerase A (cyclophilin A)
MERRLTSRMVRGERMRLRTLVFAACVSVYGAAVALHAQANPRVLVQTELGDIVLEIDVRRAPNTAANFLKYVDAGHYDGGTFHRTVRMDNQPESPVKIEVIQAGVAADKVKQGFPPISLERTTVTGILHKDGVVSMARGTPDSATSGWFITINDQPSLDFGGARNPDGQGFAAFGRVVAGMDVVRKIQSAPSSKNTSTNVEAQRLTPPIKIIKVSRVTSSLL